MARIEIDDSLLMDIRFIEFVDALSKITSPTKVARKAVKKEATESSGHLAVARYCECYVLKYPGSKPVITGMDGKRLKAFVKDVGLKRAIELIEGYFIMPDSIAVKRAHPLQLFFLKIQEIQRFIDTGNFVAQATATDVDREIADKFKEARERVERERALEDIFQKQIGAPDEPG